MQLKTDEEKHRAWLKDYEGLHFSIGEDKQDRIRWKEEMEKYVYSDKRFGEPIICLDFRYRAEPNKIQRHPQRIVVEFDGEKAKEFFEETKTKIKNQGWGYIESSHGGKCNYLWLEFTRKITDDEARKFLRHLAPAGSEIDLNFANNNFRLPVLFAEHWKYKTREIPVDFFSGEQIDYDFLFKEGKPETKKNEQGEYQTFKKSAGIFSRKGQAEEFYQKQPYFYDRAGMWWMWDNTELFWKLTDEVDILGMINDAIGTEIIKSSERNEITNALKQVGRNKIPKPIQPTWIQFKDEIFDIGTGETLKPTPEYFVTNPVPYHLHREKYMLTPVIDRIFAEWVGDKYVRTLHEIIAYCLLPSYPLNRLFCFIGNGMNGKTKFLELLSKFIGEHNCTSTELDTLLNSRFEVTRLHKKLVCQMGETNFNEISKTSILKKLTGGDLIGFEYKNKNPFHDKNYAKILISTNSLPTTTDKTIGFYRRWLIVDFPNQFSEQKDILAEIPEEEYECLALKSCFILKELLDERKFTNEGSIEERMEKYEAKSDFLQKFIESSTLEDTNGFITNADFYKKFTDWCRENRHRLLSETSLSMKMKEKGFENGRKYFDWMYDGKGGQARVWLGMKWKD